MSENFCYRQSLQEFFLWILDCLLHIFDQTKTYQMTGRRKFSVKLFDL